MYLKNFKGDLCLPGILEKIHLSIYKFNNKRVDSVITAFLLFTQQVSFFGNLYITYFSNIYFDTVLKLINLN